MLSCIRTLVMLGITKPTKILAKYTITVVLSSIIMTFR